MLQVLLIVVVGWTVLGTAVAFPIASLFAHKGANADDPEIRPDVAAGNAPAVDLEVDRAQRRPKPPVPVTVA